MYVINTMFPCTSKEISWIILLLVIISCFQILQEILSDNEKNPILILLHAWCGKFESDRDVIVRPSPSPISPKGWRRRFKIIKNILSWKYIPSCRKYFSSSRKHIFDGVEYCKNVFTCFRKNFFHSVKDIFFISVEENIFIK